MTNPFQCRAPGCNKGFQRQANLTVHQTKCKFWKRAQEQRLKRCMETSELETQEITRRALVEGGISRDGSGRAGYAGGRDHSHWIRYQNRARSSLSPDPAEDNVYSNKRRRVESESSTGPSEDAPSAGPASPQDAQNESQFEGGDFFSFEALDMGSPSVQHDGGVEVESPPPLTSTLNLLDGENKNTIIDNDLDASFDQIPYVDVQPEGPGPLLGETPLEINRPRIRLRLLVRDVFRMAANAFGLYREYYDNPASSVLDTSEEAQEKTQYSVASSVAGISLAPNVIIKAPLADLSPFRNMSEFLVQYWHWMFGAKKTNQTRETLVDMVNTPFFQPRDILHTNWKSLDRKLAHQKNNGISEEEGAELRSEGWLEHNAEIAIPFKGRATFDPYNDSTSNQSIPPNNVFKISNLWTRSLPHLIRNLAETQSATRSWDWMPYEEYWQPEGTPTPTKQRVYGEVASSTAFMEAHKDVQRIQIPGCQLPKAVVSVMLWSDSTHLGSFTDASLHPVYVGFGNESKYSRGEPTSRACHQIAFLPKMDDSLSDFLVQLGLPKGADPKLMAHCRRELMHTVWLKLLDDDFMDGYRNGWVVTCEDGVKRRIFPRIFTYSADYPEKVMLACIRDKGDHPCPRCYVSKKELDRTGTYQDSYNRKNNRRIYTEAIQSLIAKARGALYRGLTLASVHVDGILKPKSLVPTMSAFVYKLGSLGLDHYRMLVIDFMHEFELGVWRSIVHHIVRILSARGEEYVREFDKRLRATPTFGPDTIRKMRNNVSQFKKFAARDYEDLLQIIIPAMEGLLPSSDNAAILALLYVLALYLSLGKLRLHTDSTLAYWELVIRVLGDLVRQFRDDISPRYATKETTREAQARVRRAAGNNATSTDSTRRARPFNLTTYKFHALGDGPDTVRVFGTTDSYSTWIGELLHKRPKAQFGRTAKNKSSTRGVTEIDSREEELLRLGVKYESSLPPSFLGPLKHLPKQPLDDSFPLENHHQIPESQNTYLDLPSWLSAHREEEPVATLTFMEKLENHLISRFDNAKSEEQFPQFSQERRRRVFIQHHRIYSHKRLRIHYTTYDVRRAVDIINLQSGKQDILVARSNQDYPFSYARVVGIYHVKASYRGCPPVRYELLWVRWFTKARPPNSTQSSAALEAVQFEPEGNLKFGFVNPATVVRACHLIPAWHHGVIAESERDTRRFTCVTGLPDYKYYYINNFVDRDMFMRYLGGGVGHAGGGAVRNFQGNIDTTWPGENAEVDERPERAPSPGSGIEPHSTFPPSFPFINDQDQHSDIMEQVPGPGGEQEEDPDHGELSDSDSDSESESESDHASDDPDYNPNTEDVDYDLEYSL